MRISLPRSQKAEGVETEALPPARQIPAPAAGTLADFLAECRSTAITAADAGLVLDRVEIKIGQLSAERSKVEDQLRDAVVSGASTDKLHRDLARMDQDLMTLQAALSGFGQRQRDLHKVETETDAVAGLDRLKAAAVAFEAAAVKHREAIEASRTAAGTMLDASEALQRQIDRQAALGIHPLREFGHCRPDAIARRVGAGLAVATGGAAQMRSRMDGALAELLTGASLKNIRGSAHRHGKPGLNGLTRAKVADGYMNLAKDIERKAGLRND